MIIKNLSTCSLSVNPVKCFAGSVYVMSEVEKNSYSFESLSRVSGRIAEISQNKFTNRNFKTAGQYRALASAVGVNANNGNASQRTLNANNCAGNSNDDFGFCSALISPDTILTAGSSRAKITNQPEEEARAFREYDNIPFTCSSETETEDARELTGPELWKALDAVNSRKRLKNLKQFICNREIIRYAAYKVLQGRKRNPDGEYVHKEAAWMEHNMNEFVENLRAELAEERYQCGYHRPKHIPGKWKHQKDREAFALSLKDQTVQTILLTVCRKKFTNVVPRNVYSNIPGRGIWSNNPVYCLKDQLATWCTRHPDTYFMAMDIRKFYPSLSSKIVLGTVFKYVYDSFARKLFANIILDLDVLPLGDCLSPSLANLTMAEMYRNILKKFKPSFFAVYGDDGGYGDSDKFKLERIHSYVVSYLEGRYGLSVKYERHITPVSAGFSFLRVQFHPGYTRVRGEIRRRAIRSFKNPESFAGYYGMLKKTKSRKFLQMLISSPLQLRSSRGLPVKRFPGIRIKFAMLENKKLMILDAQKCDNNKESGYFWKFSMYDRETRTCYCTQSGSEEIKLAMDHIVNSSEEFSYPIQVTIRACGSGHYFEEFHVSADELGDIIDKYISNL